MGVPAQRRRGARGQRPRLPTAAHGAAAPERSGADGGPRAAPAGGSGADAPVWNMTQRQPKIGVFKFASCDGCQLTLLDCEDELLAIAGAVEIAYFPEATRRMVKGPYDLGLVEGSITTHEDAARIQHVRQACRHLIVIGACATSGGIQALRNWQNVDEMIRLVYATPGYISTLADVDPDLGARTGRLRATRVPDRQAVSSSRSSPPYWRGVDPRSPPTASAWSASGVATSVSRSRTGRRVSVR